MTINNGWIAVENVQWHCTKKINGLDYRLLINRSSGEKLPFICYASLAGTLRRTYLGPAATLSEAKRKCEALEMSSRDPIPDAPMPEPAKKTAKTRVRSLPRR